MILDLEDERDCVEEEKEKKALNAVIAALKSTMTTIKEIGKYYGVDLT